MKKKTCLVTGGNGYIGSHMVKILADMGHKVHWIDNFSAGAKRPVHHYGEGHRLDIADKKVVSLLKKIRPGHVLHFAARANVPEGEDNPFFYYRENVGKTIQFLESCVSAKVQRFIFSSTAAVYGRPQAEVLTEEHPRQPINTYGVTKMLMEKVMEDLCRKKLINVVALRYFNVVGLDPEGTLGEHHHPETHLVPKIIEAHLKGRSRPFEIFGEEYSTHDGTCIRDYIHVMDLVYGHLMAMDFLEDHQGFHAFNLGNGRGHSVKEVAQSFEQATGEKLKLKFGPPREGDVPALVASNQKAQRNWGFACHYSLQDAILHALAYARKKASKKRGH